MSADDVNGDVTAVERDSEMASIMTSTSTSTDGPLYKINPSHHFYSLVWAYESIPTIIGCGVDKVNDHAIPRMLRWVCQQSPKSQTISQVFDSPMSKNGGSKRVREVVNDEDDFKKSKKQKSKIKMKKAIRNLQDRVAVVEGQLNSIKSDIDELKGMMSTILKHIGLQRKGDEGDRKVSKGLVDHTLESKEVIKAAVIPSSQNFTTADTIFMRILVSKWPLYKECIKENRPFDWDEEYRLVDYVVGSKEDFQDPWTSVDYVYSPFNVHGNHWVLLCFDLVSCQVKVWDSLPSLTTAEKMTNILLPIRELVSKLLDSSGFFDRRGRSSTYKEPWPVVIVDSIPLQRNNSDYGIFTIKYFEYIAAGVGLDTLCQENVSYFRKQLAFQL
ncbi:Ulp1-like peptidase [Cucumis melo var. makuwa]|uniref:Ulp1-like peptidase n=1 Tax=Cucumis melo var. makuwa TaxID=1194695 RepID=A0A5D3C7G9_CUCMM|nr:Ulp1-like peptidase [Cucumis melo var. makuwa]